MGSAGMDLSWQKLFRGKSWQPAGRRASSDQQLPELRKDKLKSSPQNLTLKLGGEDINATPGMSLFSLCRLR